MPVATQRPVFQELGTQTIEKGLADPLLSAFYESMMSSANLVTDKLREHMPYLSLCSDKLVGCGPPPIFYVGRRSSQRRLFGDEWAQQLGQALTTPDPDLEFASADGYRAALAGKPYYGYARTTLHFESGPVDIAFERLIMTLKPTPNSNRRFCAYFGVIQDLQDLR
ncbi:hypothetical protein GCM10011316_15550 [Roseibium aquae]|uniref:PAS domain-containing protein n=1 Tax=Roseibium aquae TaxID=1323746 RepID=A0A916TJG9_9HYPH|nr:hypothetical protein [Roseibium aquae]GGB44431.1 hypothetical protein GCM10011316_15550 [Roseibium aquae]